MYLMRSTNDDRMKQESRDLIRIHTGSVGSRILNFQVAQHEAGITHSISIPSTVSGAIVISPKKHATSGLLVLQASCLITTGMAQIDLGSQGYSLINSTTKASPDISICNFKGVSHNHLVIAMTFFNARDPRDKD